ncbi:amidase [Skermanella stibiiresistens]|nr:amidase [Skermanella stibiiresistens]
MTEPASLGISRALQAIRSGALSPTALVQEMLDRISRFDGRVRSFVHLDPAGALAAARRIEAAAATGGALSGIPLGLKDLFDTADMPTTGCSLLFEDRRPERDALSVARLRSSGAVILGKLAAWECGMGGTSFTSPWPPTRNPWDLGRDPGGSSSGSAAAVAAGFCLGATGSDTGGSIREPASWCGIAGLKPTYGLVDVSGVMAASHSLDHVGPMARDSRDCAVMLDVMAGKERDACFSKTIDQGVAGLRIAVVDLDHEDQLHLDEAIAGGVDRAAALLTQRGAVVTRVRLPKLGLFSAVCTVLASVEGFALHRTHLTASSSLYDPLTLRRLLVGGRVSANDHRAAERVREILILRVAEAMASLDLVVMPTTRVTAPVLGGFDSHGGHPSLTRPWNVTGYPALSIRLGFDGAGLPVGLQIAGHPFTDALVLRAGHALESGLDDRCRWPDLEAAAAPPPPPDPAIEVSDERALEALADITERAAELVRSAARSGG